MSIYADEVYCCYIFGVIRFFYFIICGGCLFKLKDRYVLGLYDIIFFGGFIFSLYFIDLDLSVVVNVCNMF